MVSIGIDISSNNAHPINYDAAVADLEAKGQGAPPFVFVKISQGETYVNPDEHPDVVGFRAAMARAGLPSAVAVYIFANFPTDDPADELAFARAHQDPGLPDEWDWETGGTGGPSQAKAVEAVGLAGPSSLLYGPLSYLSTVPQVPAGNRWLAYPTSGPPPLPCVVHQFSATGSVAGIGGAVDLNRFLGSAADFARVFNLAPPAPPRSEDDMPTIVIVAPGVEAPIPVPPPHGGGIYGKGYGNVWVSFTRDFVDDPARIALGSPSAWRWMPGAGADGYVAVPHGVRLVVQLESGDEIVSVRNDRSQHPLGVMVEAELAT